MAHRVSGSIQALEHNRFADINDVTGTDASVDIRNAIFGICVRDDLCAGGGNHAFIATRVITMLVRI